MRRPATNPRTYALLAGCMFLLIFGVLVADAYHQGLTFSRALKVRALAAAAGCLGAGWSAWAVVCLLLRPMSGPDAEDYDDGPAIRPPGS